MIAPALAALMEAADETTWKLVRQMVGQEQLALLIANGLIGMTTGKLDSKAVAEAFGISEQSARTKAENVTVRKGESSEEWIKSFENQ
jgi:hypothetical protein